MADQDMFRKEALEQLSSPEQLEQLMEVTTRKAWVALYTIGASLLVILLWSIFGQIPMTVDGSGIFVHPRRVVSFQSPAPGQIVAIKVGVGDFVFVGVGVFFIDVGVGVGVGVGFVRRPPRC